MTDIEDAYRLSTTQKGMLFHTAYGRQVSVYVQQMIGQLREPLNVSAFWRAWQQIAERHAVLRTSFSFERFDEPLQRVHRRLVLPFEELDWRNLSNPEQDRRFRAYLEEDRRIGFDFAKAPLMRLALFHLGDADYRLVWTSHHALFDGRSRLVLLCDLFAVYEACCRGENLALPQAPLFKAHIDWLDKQDFSQAENFWRRELKGASLPTRLGIDSLATKSPVAEERQGSRTLRLSNSLTGSLNKLAEKHQLTLNTLLQGAWALLLSRYSGEREVLFGATRACRHSPVEGAESIVGLLINTVPVRVSVSEDRELIPWLEELRAKWIAIREYEQTPLSKIQEWSGVPGSTPLFESLLVFENFELNAILRSMDKGFEQREFQLIGRTNYPLTISCYRDQQLLVKVDYDRNRFQDMAITRLLGHVETVLTAMISNPGQKLADLSILTETERQRILVEWNDTAKLYPRNKCIHELFEERVERTPTAVAVVYENRQLTYLQLNERSNRLAHYLRRRGIGPDSLVGICMERSPDLIVAMLGILKAGGAYVPLDVNYPRARLEFMLADTRMCVLVADKAVEQLPGSQAEVVCLNSDWEDVARESDRNPSSGTQPDSLAYVIYTSGSTGQPKGVAVSHRAVSRLVCNTNYAQLGPSDRVAQVSNCSFDAATFEVWGALLHGACLVVVAQEVVLSSRHFATEIREREISTLFLTTSLFNQLASDIPHAFKTVTHLLIGGEAADPRWVREVLSCGAPRRLVNAYGPTESTTFAVWHLTPHVPSDAISIPIGRPISNTQIYLLDARLRPIPVGVAGQLYIGGDGLARCYLNRPELTAESFVPHPFSTEPGARLYRTGDLARYLPDGTIEFLGRADHQVKIRGFRIELGEIETALQQHPSIRQAVVVADEGPNGSKDLTGYVVPADHDSTTVRRLRDFLKGKLPDYMIPAKFVFLDSVPLTPNGKLDRRGLAKPGLTRSEPINVGVAPRNRTEETLVRIWCQALAKEAIGIHDNFFDLGGSSLLAMRVISNVWRSLGIDLPMRQLFDAPTVAGLAECIGNDGPKSRQLPGMPLRASHRNQEIPLSPRQKFCLDQKNIFVDKPVFNICRVVRLRGALQKEVLQRAFNDLVARHESLRTSFSVSPSGDPVQVIQLPGEVTLPLVDLSNLATPDRESIARSLSEEEGLIVFRLSESPLLRLKLIRLAQDEHWLVLVLSHFVADGWSLKVLFRELGTIYTAYCRNERPELPVLSIQFADYVLWQWQYLRSERDQLVSYWKQQLGGDLSGLKLPFDYPRPNAPTLQARRETVFLSRALRDSVSQLGKQQQATHSMVLLAAFKTLLYLYTGQVDIVTGASDANRNDIETADVIGLFTNITLFRSNLSGNPTFLELLHRVRNVVLESYQHRGLSAELLEAECRRDTTDGDPMYQCRFLEAPDSRLELSMGELEAKVLPREQCQMRSDLRVFVGHTDKGIEVRWDYSADLFKPETIQLMLRRYRSLLQQIVLSPNKRLSDFSLDSLDEGQQTRSGEPNARELEAAGATATHPSELLLGPNHVEETLLRIWHQVLGKEGVGIHDNFFDLGGNSLLAMQVISQSWRSLGVDLPVRQLFDAPTVAGLAERIKRQKSEGRELQEMPLTTVPRNQRMPLSLAQERSLIGKNIFVERGAGNIGRIMRLRGPLQMQPLQDALNNLIARHESLRTSFPSSETGELLQRIHPEGRISISTIDLGTLLPLEREKEARRLAEEEALKVFSVAESPPFRVTLLRLSHDEHWMVMVIHHLIADGWSLKVLFQELGTIYTAHCRDEKPDLAGLPIQFADYAFWQRQYLQDEPGKQLVSYWKQRLNGKLSSLKLPFDHPRPKVSTFRARRETVLLPDALQKSLRGLGQREHATEFMVELAAFNLLLHLYTGETDILVGIPIANRSQIETVNVIGCFADTVLCRSDLSRNPTFVELVTRIRTVVLEAYQHQALPYLEVVKLVNWGGDSGSLPTQCSFSETPDANLGAAMEGLEVETLPREQLSMTSDLRVVLGHTDKGIEMRWDYSADLFKPETMHLMVHRYYSLLEQIVLSPNKQLADFSLDSLEKQQTRSGEIQVAKVTATHPIGLTRHRNHVEETLVRIWRQVLRKEGIGIHDNFFDLGGNSLLAMQLIPNVWRSLGIDLPVRQFFDAPTVAGLTEIIKRQETEARDLPEMPLKAAPRSQEIPVSHRQEFYLSVETGIETGRLNICRILKLCGSLQTDILQLALNDLIARHESLRTAFGFTPAGTPIQLIHLERKVAIPVVDLSGLAPLDKVKEARRLTEEEGSRAFRLAESPLLRVKLIRISQSDYWLVLIIHHLVTDGWSLKVLLEELCQIYTAHSRGETPDLALLPIQFADYALWERQHPQGEWDRRVSYWKHRLEGNLTGLNLPLDRARPKTPTLGARRETVFLPIQLQKSISKLAREQQATKFIVLLAAFKQLLHLHTGQVDIVVGTSVANRSHTEAMGVIGCFSNLILVRSDLSGNPTFLELLKRVRNVTLEGNQYQGPALELFDVANWRDGCSADPRYQCRFSEAPDSGLELAMGELEVEIVPREQVSMGHDFRVVVGYTRQGIEVRWDYNTDLFNAETIHLMLQRYQSLLEQIVLTPSMHLFDFSLDSLDKGLPTPCRELPAQKLPAADEPTIHLATFRPEPGTAKHAPLSLAQQRLWFLDQMEPGSSVYNVNQMFLLRGILHLDALRRALNAVVARHETLRTTFTSHDGDPVQVIAPALNIRVPVIDLESFPEPQVEAQQSGARQSEQPFDLRNGPLLRVTLFRLAPTEHWLLLSVHHIVSDGWSLGVLQRELSAFYAAFSKGVPLELPELPIQYADYAAWQQRQSQGGDSHLAFWKQHLSGCVPVLRLPTDRPRPEAQTYQGARQLIVLPKALASSLDRLNRQQGCTLFMTLLAAFNVLLHRITLQEDIVVGVPTAGRTQPETEGLIGFFVNTLPLRMNLSDSPSFRTLLHRVRDNALEAYSHQDCPFEKLVEELHLERSLSHTPLFQVMLNVWTLAANSFTLPDLNVEMLERTEAKSKFDLTLYAWEHDEGLRLSLVYNASLFDQVRMTEFLRQLRYLLEQVVEDPERPIHSYSLVTPHFRTVLPDPTKKLLEPPYELVTRSFLSWADLSPDHTAVCQDERTWSYKELSHSARSLALALLEDGMSPGDVVVVTGPKSFGLVTSFMGVMMGAGILLPIDPSLPPDRQRLLLQESRAKRICYIGEWSREDSWMREMFPSSLSVDPDDGRVLGTAVIGAAEPDKLPELLPSDPAYIFFTSGTTGVPKGVLGSHKGLSHFVTWQKETFSVGPQDRCAQLTNLSFDVVLRDIFLPLVSGATICLPDDVDVSQVLSWLDRQRVTLLHVVPSLAELWLATASERVTLRSLRWVFFAGEALSDTLVRNWRETFQNSGSVVNLYGPTETTMVKCFYVVPHGISIGVQPVGKPLPQAQALILTEGSQLCGLGELGEIVLRTPFRTLGYINAEQEGRSRFVRNPFRDDPSDVLYFTGDLGRYLPDGFLEILGRLDDQVKIRGVRVEPGEVTAILCQVPQVRTGLVVARKKDKENVLVAYVVPSSAKSVTTTELKTHLSRQLPAAMIPTAFVFLEDLPLMSNGKVNRNALPTHDSENIHEVTPFVGPRNPLEATITSIWCEHLELKQVGIYDNFFDLGGHSLLAMKLSSKLSVATNHVVSVRSLFLYPNIAALAEALVDFPLLKSGPSIKEVSLKHVGDADFPREPLQPSSPYLKIERRSLLSLLGVGKITPVDAVAVGCLPDLLLADSNITKDEVLHDWYEGIPALNAITETSLGRIGTIRLPRFRSDIYSDPENLLDLIVEALELARQIGARVVSLTGLIPSATDYGQAVTRRITGRTLPQITTGHATIAATVVLSVLEILKESGRDPEKERIGFLGLGSIGATALRLMLRALPHPAEIILCDIYSKLDSLESLRKELVDKFGFKGLVTLMETTTGIPQEFYQATLIVGATNVPEILNLESVRPGTLIVDDRRPQCLKMEDAVQRFLNREDILFTEGDTLRSPDALTQTKYLPRQLEQKARRFWVDLIRRYDPVRITGCVFSSLLSARYQDLKPTLGVVNDHAALQHYQKLIALRFRAFDLHCESYLLPQASIRNFRRRFGRSHPEAQEAMTQASIIDRR